MVVYLTNDDLLKMNARFVGPNQLRDFGLLDAAVARPQSSAFGADAFPGIHEKAAALLHGIARNHPFVDGNKRTALSAVSVFYLVNGYEMRADQGDLVALTVDVAEGQLDVVAAAGRLKDYAPPLPECFDPFS